jgi:hypothetical protein
MVELTEWDGFYAIVGSAAGALIGLQLVVAALVAERPPLRTASSAASPDDGGLRNPVSDASARGEQASHSRALQTYI